jgi:hypothetical protein
MNCRHIYMQMYTLQGSFFFLLKVEKQIECIKLFIFRTIERTCFVSIKKKIYHLITVLSCPIICHFHRYRDHSLTFIEVL